MAEDMSRLDLAQKRLADALAGLERAAGGAQQREKRTAQADAGSALAKERDRLMARVTQLEDELSALSGTSQDVEARLDGAIGEIRAALATSR